MLPTVFEKFLKSGGRNEVNREALEFFKKRASEILNFFENHNTRIITGSSLLILIDNPNNWYEMKVIDVNSM